MLCRPLPPSSLFVSVHGLVSGGKRKERSERIPACISDRMTERDCLSFHFFPRHCIAPSPVKGRENVRGREDKAKKKTEGEMEENERPPPPTVLSFFDCMIKSIKPLSLVPSSCHRGGERERESGGGTGSLPPRKSAERSGQPNK